MTDRATEGLGESGAYHRLVKTTPKPRATKNSRGELVGPELFGWGLLVGVGWGGSAEDVGADMVASEGFDEVI